MTIQIENKPLFTFRLFVEAFAVITGLSFIISGAMNAYDFYIEWGLDYFIIAQPSDIVMSGFGYVVQFLLILALSVVSSIALIGVIETINYVGSEVVEAELNGKAQGKYRFNDLRRDFLKFVLRRRRDIAIYAACIYIITIVIGAVTVREASPIFYFRHKIMTTLGIPDGGLKTQSFMTGRGLYLAKESTLYPRCGAAPVLWLGGSSAVLNCHGRVLVIHNTQDLPLDG